MTPQEELQVLNNAVIFLRRAQLSGEEVQAFGEVMQYLAARHQGLTGMLQAAQNKKELAAQEEKKAE